MCVLVCVRHQQCTLCLALSLSVAHRETLTCTVAGFVQFDLARLRASPHRDHRRASMVRRNRHDLVVSYTRDTAGLDARICQPFGFIRGNRPPTKFGLFERSAVGLTWRMFNAGRGSIRLSSACSPEMPRRAVQSASRGWSMLRCSPSSALSRSAVCRRCGHHVRPSVQSTCGVTDTVGRKRPRSRSWHSIALCSPLPAAPKPYLVRASCFGRARRAATWMPRLESSSLTASACCFP